MINSVSNSLAGTNFAQRDYVIVDGKRYPVQKRPYNDQGVFSIAQSYRDVVVIDGKEYPVEKVSDWRASDKTKEVVIIDGKEYEVNAPLSLESFLPQGLTTKNVNETYKFNCVA